MIFNSFLIAMCQNIFLHVSYEAVLGMLYIAACIFLKIIGTLGREHGLNFL